MKKVSLIHCADIHLDALFTRLPSEEYSHMRQAELKKTFQSIIDIMLLKNADYLLISGDLYEHNSVSVSTIHWLNEQFSRLGDKLVVIIPGNHDPYVKNSWYRSYPWHANVHILSTEAPDFFDEAKQVYFYGIGFDTFRQEQLPAQKPPERLDERINICLFHGTVDMEFTEQPYNPVSSVFLADMGFDYYAFGHFHKRSDHHQGKGMINPGSPEPLGFDEQGEHGVYWVSISKEGVEIQRQYQFLPIQQRQYREITIDITGLTNEFDLVNTLAKAIEGKAEKKDMVKLLLTGRRKQGLYIDAKELERTLCGKCLLLRCSDLTRPDYDLEELALERNITGIYVRIMTEKISRVQDEEKEVLEKALYLGLDALLSGCVQQP